MMTGIFEFKSNCPKSKCWINCFIIFLDIHVGFDFDFWMKKKKMPPRKLWHRLDRNWRWIDDSVFLLTKEICVYIHQFTLHCFPIYVPVHFHRYNLLAKIYYTDSIFKYDIRKFVPQSFVRICACFIARFNGIIITLVSHAKINKNSRKKIVGKNIFSISQVKFEAR